jgi:hypothetical protein
VRILIDECLPVKLRQWLPGHDVSTVEYMGWKGLKNGKLLTASERAGFDMMLTADGKMGGQQNMEGRRICVMAIPTNDIRLVKKIAQAIHEALPNLKPGRFYSMSLGGEVRDETAESKMRRKSLSQDNGQAI